MSKIMCQRFLISGRVQGVFYRQSTLQKAQALELTGWVKNLADGRVEAVACGREENLLRMLEWLKVGPPAANVNEVIAENTSITEFVKFEIR